MALDPIIGTQLLSCLRCFLELRSQAMPRDVASSTNRNESQDEYADFGIDYADPIFDRILGLPEQPPRAKRNDDTDAKAEDKKFAEVCLCDFVGINVRAQSDSTDRSSEWTSHQQSTDFFQISM